MKQYIYILVVLGFVLASCSKDNKKDAGVGNPDIPVTPPTPDDPTTKVSFSPSIAAFTKATGKVFEPVDEVSVYAVKVDAENLSGTLSSMNFADNVRYIYRNLKFEAFNQPVAYPDKTMTLAFHAIYPYSSGYSVPEFLFAVSKDQSNENDYAQSDLLTAFNKSEANSLIPLMFTHRFSKIVVNLILKGVAANGIKVSFSNLYSLAKVDLNNLVSVATGAKGNLIPAENGSLSYKLILPPQDFTKDVELATIFVAGDKYVWKLSGNQKFVAGNEYSYNLEISESEDEKKVVVISSSINPWESAEIENGNIR